MSNGFDSDWMPSGYRDVKVNAVVSNHLCEIQLQLRDFFSLKAGQHEVYEWARTLKVTAEMTPELLLENMSRDILAEMIAVAGQNWYGTEHILPELHLSAGHFRQAQEILDEVTRSTT